MGSQAAAADWRPGFAPVSRTMKSTTFNDLFAADRAVSPVIGVILMVAITVILAAVIGTFVLGIAPGESPGPSSQISFQDAYENENVTIVHNGGDTIDLSAVTLLVDGSSINSTLHAGSKSTLSAGERIVVEVEEGEIPEGDGVEFVLRHDPSGSIIGSATLDVE